MPRAPGADILSREGRVHVFLCVLEPLQVTVRAVALPFLLTIEPNSCMCAWTRATMSDWLRIFFIVRQRSSSAASVKVHRLVTCPARWQQQPNGFE